MTSIFVFAYYSYKDPVFQSAVLPYLKIVRPSRFRFIILTWEQDKFRVDKQERARFKRDLSESNIIWHETRWHSGRFKFVKKCFDLFIGIVLSSFLIRKYKARKILSEGFPGAVIGHCLSILTRIPHAVHTFEPHADYMLEAGVWRKNSWEYRILRFFEKPIAKRAECVITGTDAYKELLFKMTGKMNVHVIPSCVDTKHYRFDVEKRNEIRKGLGIIEDQIAIAYMGKIGGMYMDEEIFEFIKYCLSLDERRFFFFLFTNEDATRVNADLRKFGIPLAKVFVRFLDKNEVPAYLSAADIGFCGIRPLPSRRYSSPIKNGEYWACGLPVLIPKGVSDDYIHSLKYNIGFPFGRFEEISLPTLQSLKEQDRSQIERQSHSLRALTHYREQICRAFSVTS